jgi:hypothetical protein
MTRRHLIIPDCQVKPGYNYDYLNRIGKYIVDHQPDTVVNIGDFADMPSLSSYDVGKKSFEGRRYIADVEASREAMGVLLSPLKEYNNKQRRNGKKQYKPRMILTLGNHENRINRVVDGDPKLDGTISVSDLDYEAFGWEVFPFLEVVVADGIAYSHYFVSGVAGRPISSASQILTKKHMSCIAGHQQGRQTAYGYRADGRRITSIIAGSCYEHDEDYMGPQGNKHWRGIIMLNEVNDGEFDELYVSLDYLGRKYGR